VISSVRRLIALVSGTVGLLTVAWSSYLVVMSAAAMRARRAGRHHTKLADTPSTRFRVLVPAHNESALIAETMSALAAIDYPADLFEVHVVADNCTDDTAAIVRSHGFDAHERDDLANPGKGPALGWLLDCLPTWPDTTSAFVLIDADTIVDPDLLAVFDARLGAGDDVVQGYYAVRDAGAGGNIAFRAAALAVRHYVRPLGRTELGGSSGLYGNGMAFRESVARANPWSDHLVEDIEMAQRLLLDGGRVGFAPDAVVQAEMPVTLADATTQNQRWEAGRGQVAQAFVPPLVGAAIRRDHRRRWPYVDAIFDLTLPPITSLMAVTGLTASVFRLSARGRVGSLGFGLGTAAGLAQIAHILGALRMVRAPLAVYRALLLAPIHMVWKVILLIRLALKRGPDGWIRTTRNEESL